MRSSAKAWYGKRPMSQEAATPCPLETQLQDMLKQAMREKDTNTSGVVRMLKTKIMERRTSKGFTGGLGATGSAWKCSTGSPVPG